MSARVPLFIAALGLCATVTQAQPSLQRPLPKACEVNASETLPQLEQRRQSLEREIAREGASVEQKPKDTKSGPNADMRAKELRLHEKQGDLLEVLFRIECQRSVEVERSRNPFAKQNPQQGKAIEITVYYATNRSQTGSTDPWEVYGPEMGRSLQFGHVVVAIPPAHVPGNLELPSLWKLVREDSNKHFDMKSVQVLSVDTARQEMARSLQSMGSKALLIFVHGFNMSFPEAALRTAQMAHDLKFPGMAFFYSWPSASRIRSYWQDEEAARLSEGVFDQLLDELSPLPVTEIYIVAHSMGNRIVGHALQARADKGKETHNLKELLLAAPDINAEVFRTVIAPRLASMTGARTTVYASSSDIALKVSKVVHGFRRVGETTGGVLTYPGIEMIDASSESPALRGYGHLYVVDSVGVLRDIRSIIEKKVPAKLRGLTQEGISPNLYWKLP